MNRVRFFHLLFFIFQSFASKTGWGNSDARIDMKYVWNVFCFRACAVAPVIDAGRESFYD